MALILSNLSVPLSPLVTLNDNLRLHSRVIVRSVSCEDSGTVSRESVRINDASCVNRKGINVAPYDDGGKKSGQDVPQELKPLWDDGYGTRTIWDFVKVSMDLAKSDGGPPRWFCPVSCGKPIKDSPVLLYLPGIDGTGAGLVLHEKSLGKVFHIQCLHIPAWDRTPLEGLIQIVEDTVMIEHALCPNKPIYLLGDSFGGTLALVVAARNPKLDLILVLANPATSYERSALHPLSALLRALPEEFHGIVPYAMSPLLGDYVNMTMVESDDRDNLHSLWQLPCNLSRDLSLLSVIARILPKDTLKWRLKLVESASAYANSRLHAVAAQVLVLASGKDNLMPSNHEAQRLSRLLKHCNVRVFEENGHAILMENGVNVLSVVKATQMYRKSSKHDIFKDFLHLGKEEFKSSPAETWAYRVFMGATAFSTMEDGKIVRGLGGIPEEGPVLFVGNHMLLAIDAFPLVTEFMREKKLVLHSLAHPELFHINVEHESIMIPITDMMKIGGSIPVSGRNFFRLLARKSHTLLYPGGIREALHLKGEAYKLFWPDQEEFVRMAVKFGTTIIPFGVVGEDDFIELIIDYNEIKRIPFLNQMWNEYNQGRTNLREGMSGEVAKQQFHIPIFSPKMPGRLYFMFGNPIRTKGKENMSNDRDYVQEIYSQTKCHVKNNIAYLLKKREEDPYRGIVERLVWQMINGTSHQIPSFEPKGMGGEIAKQQFHIPISLPKVPGRLYFMFGKPIRTKGREYMSNDKAYLRDLYLQIRCEVENNMAYLLKKREEDLYRSIVKRLAWCMVYRTLDQIPSFEP